MAALACTPTHMLSMLTAACQKKRTVTPQLGTEFDITNGQDQLSLRIIQGIREPKELAEVLTGDPLESQDY